MKVGVSALVLTVLCLNANAATLAGRVVKVADGDTITVLDASLTQHRIRLYGIDAPEKKQPFGTVCRGVLASLVAGQQVQVDVRDQDRYGRSIGIVTVGKTDANEKMVDQGCAWAYRKYSTAYLPEEAEARRRGVGLWADKEPTPPWEYRKASRAAGL